MTAPAAITTGTRRAPAAQGPGSWAAASASPRSVSRSPRGDEAHERARRGGRGWTLAVVSVAAFMLMLDITVVNVALPGIRRSLGASFADLQWVLDAYALTLAVFLLTAGSLGDTWGRKRVFAAGLAAFTAASLAAGLAPSALALTLARAAEGIGGAVLYATGPALIGNEYRGRQRGLAFGIFGGVSGLAVAAGPLAGGALAGTLGWRWIFLINVPIGALALLVARWRVRDSKNPAAAGADGPGLVTFSAALAALIFALIRGGSLGWHSPLVAGLLAAAAAGLAAFTLIERARGPAAMFDLSLFRNVSFGGISAVALLASAAALPAIFLEVSSAENIHGLSPLAAGEHFLPLTLTLFLAAAAAGPLTPRIPPGALLGGSLALIAAGTALFAAASNAGAWTALIPAMIVAGAGMGISNVVRPATAIAVADPARAGMTSGINETFQQAGTAIGIAAIGAFFQSRVTAAFHLPAGIAPAGTAKLAGTAAAAGNLHAITARLPAPAAAAATQAARHAFNAGLHDALLATAAIALAGAAAGLLAIRRRDLHTSAQTGAPPQTSQAQPPAGAHQRRSPHQQHRRQPRAAHMRADTGLRERWRRHWDRQPASYDPQMAFPDLHLFGDSRAWACSQAAADTLEVAIGTGLNLPLYPGGIHLTGIDLSPAMLHRARGRALQLGRAAELQEADAQALPFPDASFDTVVCTFSLCAIPDPQQAVAEMNRVLRPGGLLLLADHITASARAIRVIQRFLESSQCRCEASTSCAARCGWWKPKASQSNARSASRRESSNASLPASPPPPALAAQAWPTGKGNRECMT